jgi:protocatechuate 3,4-dioxygenase alpha subunit
VRGDQLPTGTPEGATPSQTAGPFVSIGTAWVAGGDLAHKGDPGSILLSGTVLDGAGAPVTDAMLEFWQADRDGRFPDTPDAPWAGFARVLTDEKGRYRLATCRPGPVSATSGPAEAPHIDISIFARGLLQRLVTRAYFEDEPSNEEDPVLRSLAPDLRARLLARRSSRLAQVETSTLPVYHFDIYLQGDQETVFFAAW